MLYRHTCSQNNDAPLKMVAVKNSNTQFLRAQLYSGETLFTILQVLDHIWEISLISLTTKPCFPTLATSQPQVFMSNTPKSVQKTLDLIHRVANTLRSKIGVYSKFYKVDQATESRFKQFPSHPELSGHLDRKM